MTIDKIVENTEPHCKHIKDVVDYYEKMTSTMFNPKTYPYGSRERHNAIYRFMLNNVKGLTEMYCDEPCVYRFDCKLHPPYTNVGIEIEKRIKEFPRNLPK